MTFRLVGPFPFDMDAITASGREALSTVGKAIRDGDERELVPAMGRAPGLYVMLSGAADADVKQLRIGGMWVTLARQWMLKGPVGPPDREPPVAKQLLDAATEEVWWENLPVDSKKKGIWQPLVVLEWPPAVAYRSEVAPPGVADFGGGDLGYDQDEPESWLAAGEKKSTQPALVPAEKKQADALAVRYGHLPDDRSIISVMRGRFKKTRALHTGTFELLHPDLFGEGTDPLAFEEWIELALSDAKNPKPSEDEEQTLPWGRPLALLGGTVAFPLAGWLTRTLGLWPPHFAEVRLGALTDREVQVKWVQQARMAMSSTIAVLTLVVGFTVGIQVAAQPRPRPVAAQPPPSPQPAMSVCSADNAKFVEEFRCQIAHLASGGDEKLTEAACGDQGAETALEVGDGTLQVEYCGLHDRTADGWLASIGTTTHNFTDMAGAQACFNVLGYPFPYQHAQSGAKLMGDPAVFLRGEAQHRIQPLVDLTGELDRICEDYRMATESRIDGAIFATHIGSGTKGEDSNSEAGRLRTMAVGTALVGTSSEARKCFEVGMDDGMSAREYAGMCSEGRGLQKMDRDAARSKIWGALRGLGDGGGRGGLIDRYVTARFGPLQPSQVSELPSLWQCHLTLDGRIRNTRESALGKWDIPIPMPSRYRTSGAGVRSQLQMDSTMLALRDGTGLDQCWDVVSKRLASYVPAHPLFEPLDDAGWPSAEQQLCGQICAAAYNVDSPSGPTPWVTPKADLISCISGEPPSDPPDQGRGRLDQLRMPWNHAGRRGWVDPTQDHVCAFNLIAQGRLPAEDSYIVNNYSAQQWAGETVSGSRIAGGRDGLATQAVVGMSRFGTGSAWSVGSCGHVALQCFTGVAMEVLGDDSFERYEWVASWQRKVAELARERPGTLTETHPWCTPIQDYLSAEEAGAQFDAPCRKGVEEARKRAETAIAKLAMERD